MSGKGYFVVHEWMATELGLKGTDLLVYAIIFGFTQIEEQSFFGTRRYLAEFIGASIRNIQRSLDYLVEQGLLLRTVADTPANGMRVVSYKAVLHPQCQNVTGDKMTHNDNIHNSIKSNGVTVSKEGSSKSSRFIKPTVAEVEAYCQERGYAIDAAYFIDYYNSKGWMIGRTPMKDWKAAVRTWVRNSKKSDTLAQRKSPEPNWFDEE